MTAAIPWLVIIKIVLGIFQLAALIVFLGILLLGLAIAGLFLLAWLAEDMWRIR